jgi:hypothetical protein
VAILPTDRSEYSCLLNQCCAGYGSGLATSSAVIRIALRTIAPSPSIDRISVNPNAREIVGSSQALAPIPRASDANQVGSTRSETAMTTFVAAPGGDKRGSWTRAATKGIFAPSTSLLLFQ